MPDGRLSRQPAEVIARGQELVLRFDGKPYRAVAGDTVASALYAAGVRVFSRSFKYHRPRGLLCCEGRCPNCLVEVDGRPNVRACTEPARDGMVVRHQNAWPSLKRDLMALTDRFDRLLPVGFYYKTFIRPRRLWPLYEKVLRRLAGLGRVDHRRTQHEDYRKRHLHCDVAVIGGGPAGCMAAGEAAARGARVILIDDQPAPGGHLRVQAAPVGGDGPLAGLSGHEAARRLAESVQAQPGIEYLAGATAFGLYEDRLIAVAQGKTLVKIRARQVIVATGCTEQPAIFEHNDLPGVMLASGALRLARLYGVRPGERAVVYTDDDHGWRSAVELIEAGVPVAAVIDRRGAGEQPAEAARLRRENVQLLRGAELAAAAGRGAVSAARVRVEGGEQSIFCDLIAVAMRPEPAITLLAQEGNRPRFDEGLGVFLAGAETEGVTAAGDVLGLRDAGLALADGALAGREAVARLGLDPGERLQEAREAWRAAWDGVVAARRTAPFGMPAGGRKQFVCVCEDVAAKDIKQGIEEGFTSLETLKRYSTATMGPCQGKMCHSLAARLCAGYTGRTAGETGLTTARPPYQPVELALLAGPHLAPVRRTAMHTRHEALRPQWMDMGEWKRPLVYTSVDEESRAVHEAVGIIDVSTLGKIEVTGRDAAEYLDWLHPNRFSDLRTGRVRYRVMCDDSGVILDDGTVARLAEDRFLVTTTTGGVESVEQWLHWWLEGTGRDVKVTNVTSQLAAINLAGPKAREVLAKLTEIDVTREGMPYLAAVEGPVAGVPAVMLRIGFVGELGYEMHFPADYGDHVWDALMDAGREFGIAPFGVETQRVLRLEKQHLIVSQDTDALTHPLEAGMGWIIKGEKPDFVGRDAMAAFAASGRQLALVGFEVAGRTVPGEGDGIVRDGSLVGRVTSAKWSPFLGKTIGMGWVPAEDAEDGREITVRANGAIVTARVSLKPFYDPEGARLRM